MIVIWMRFEKRFLFLAWKFEVNFYFNGSDSACEPVESNSELHHNLLVLNTVVFDVATWILVHIKRIHNAKWKFVGLALSCEATGLLDWDDLWSGIELIQKEHKEFVKQLAHRCRVLCLSNVFFLYHLEITLKEGICFNHAEDSRVRVASLTVSIVRPTSLFRFKFLYGDWIVDRFGLLWAQLSLL